MSDRMNSLDPGVLQELENTELETTAALIGFNDEISDGSVVVSKSLLDQFEELAAETDDNEDEEIQENEDVDSREVVSYEDYYAHRDGNLKQRDFNDLLRCRELLDANYEKYYTIVCTSVKSRPNALAASRTFTVKFFLEIPLSAVGLKRLIGEFGIMLRKHGIDLPETLKTLAKTL